MDDLGVLHASLVHVAMLSSPFQCLIKERKCRSPLRLPLVLPLSKLGKFTELIDGYRSHCIRLSPMHCPVTTNDALALTQVHSPMRPFGRQANSMS